MIGISDLCPHTIAPVLNRDPSTAPSGYGYTSSYHPSQRDDATPADRLARTVSRGMRRGMKG
jgi:hypothetical protein